MDRKLATSMLELAVVLPRRLTDEGAPKKTVGAAIALLLRQAQAGDSRASLGVLRVGTLPPRLLHEVAVHFPQVAELAGVQTQTPVGSISFPRDAFFHAASTAFNTGAATVADIDGVEHRIVGVRAAAGEPATLTVEIGGEERRDTDARLGLVDPDSDLVRVIERCEVGDTGPAERARLVNDLRGLEERFDRVAVVDEHLRSGPLTFYVLLSSSLRSQAPVTSDLLMPPSVARLTGWLRLDSDDAQDVDSAAAILLRETDLFTALDRNIALPRALPAALLSAFLDQSPAERRALVKRLWRVTRHGIAGAHLCILTWHALEGTRHRSRVTDRMARRLAQVCAESAPLHLRIVRWVTNELARSKVARGWSPATTLAVAWSHGSELFRLLLDSGVPRERIATLGDQLYTYEERLFGQRAVRNDSSHPGNVQVETYALGCADLIVRRGVDLGERARVSLLAFLMTFSEDGRATGYDTSLLTRNDLLGDLLGGMFARSWDDQADDAFGNILNVRLRTWRDGVVPLANLEWLRISARNGDCLIRDPNDLREVSLAAAELPTSPVDWTSINDRVRFCLVMHNITQFDENLAEQVRSAWSSEAERASALTDRPTREGALEALLLTAVDLAAGADMEKAVFEFGRLCSLLRGTFRGDCARLDDVIRRMHPRLGSSSARHLDKLLIAGRTA